jgi:hypothetical protein
MWYLAHTLAGIEFHIRDQVAAVGVEVYVPVYQKQIRPRHVHGFRTLTLPLLPRYLMLQTDDIGRDRPLIRERTGQVWFYSYLDVVTKERRYVHMRPEDIADLKTKEAAGVWNNLKVDDPHEVRVGDVVFVVTLDRRGVVTARLSSNRAKVEINGYMITAPLHQLKREDEPT